MFVLYLHTDHRQMIYNVENGYALTLGSRLVHDSNKHIVLL